MMRKISVHAVLAATAFSVGAVFAPAHAQDAEEAPAAAAAEDGLPSPQPEAKPFTSLFKCERVTGAAQVLKVGASEWTPVKEGHFYPLGSSVRTLKEAGAPFIALATWTSLSVGFTQMSLTPVAFVPQTRAWIFPSASESIFALPERNAGARSRISAMTLR